MSEKDIIQMPIIIEPFLSIDKITLLIKTGPQFSYSSPLALDPFNKKIDSFVQEMIKDCKKKYPDSFEIKGICSNETELYHHHYRLSGGIDLQICPKFGVRHKEYDEGYITMSYGHGSEELKSFCEEGYIWETFESEYGARIEFNPAKDDISLCTSFLKYFCNKYCNPEILFDDLFKISRIDISVDYPLALNPCLFSSTARRGNQFFGPNGLETLYLGTRRSAFQFRIYNKKDELLKEHNTHYQGANLWRIECESRPSVNIGEDLNFYADIFSKLNYFYGIKTTSSDHDFFLNYAKNFGIHNAFNSIPSDEIIYSSKGKEINKKQSYKNFYNRDIAPAIHEDGTKPFLKHPKEIVGWQLPRLWREFYDDLKVYCGRENDAPLYPRNLKETI